MVQRFVGELGRRVVVGVAALSLVTGVMAWGVTQPVSVALANSCSHHSEDTCESQADRTEDAKEAQSEKQCRATHTAKFCRDQDRAEDRAEEKANECDQEGDHDRNFECEPYGGSGESHAQIGAVAFVSKSISAAGFDPGLIGTVGTVLVVVGTAFAVAARRRRIGRP